MKYDTIYKFENIKLYDNYWKISKFSQKFYCFDVTYIQLFLFKLVNRGSTENAELFTINK